ncbi:MAG TPA: M13 family metallopeptidase [Terriglobales bacterium]|nr:M13 family metallopeptidase [Terriglobales bacterium]
MKLRALALSLTLCTSLFAVAQAAQPAAATTDAPLAELPYTPSLDIPSMDRTADPCVDFYQYSCGGWKKNNPIPSDQASWSVYGKLYQDNQRYLWGLLEEAAKPDPARNASQQKIGDYFGSCMDLQTVEKLGAAPLQPELDQIAGLKSAADVADFLGREHLETVGNHLLFGFGSDQDFGDSSQIIAFASAGGLGLPDRDYYFKDDAKSKETRQKYLEHVQKMFELLGDAPPTAAANARTVMRIETALAKASLTRVERRDPHKLYHKLSRDQVKALTPHFNWDRYLELEGIANTASMNVTEPEFFKAVDAQLKSEPLADWKTYLRWHAVHGKAPYLSSRFVEEDFNFYRKHLRGVAEQQPRWKKCVAWVDRDLGEALGQVFVGKTFPPEMKARTVQMTDEIEQAMAQEIRGLGWMSPETKKQAMEKLHAIVNKVGYPDKWRDYSTLEVRRGDFIGNVNRSIIFESKRELTKIGKPVDRGEWGMTPPTVNAYYNPQMNDINFPAGVLQPPLYDPRIDDAPNYGNTGSTIGHELTHGFDDEGRQFDAQGNLRDWWTRQDAAEFEKRAKCISDQYSDYVVVDDVKINGKLTLGEDTADLGGTVLAWIAWKMHTANMNLKPIDGFTPEQRFFIGLAQWACENQRPENQRVNAITDPHSPGKYRINGVVSNLPEFEQAFSCKTAQPMVRQTMCKVW